MSLAIEVRGVGKRLARYSVDRPRTLKELLIRGFSALRPVDHFWALRDVAFDVRRGEVFGVIGHNGSGKSTLLRLLGGVMRPDKGKVAVDGRVNGLLELNTGMHADLSGRDNIIINAVVAGLTREQARKRVDEIIAFAELEDAIDSPVRTYSTGMRMRLGFAVAVHVHADVLLVDEVLAVGDIGFQRKGLDRIRRFKEEGSAVVLVTHDMSQVEALCDRVLWLRHGEVAGYGPTHIVVDQYKAEMATESRRRTPGNLETRRASSGILLTPNENRFGSLEAEILDVQLLDGGGMPVSAIDTGAPLTIEVRIDSKQLAEAPQVSISISDKQNVKCIDLNSEGDGVTLPASGSGDSIALHLERLDLGDGEYSVSVGLFEPNWAYAYDYHWLTYPLRVTAPGVSPGPMAPPRRWELRG